MLLYEKCIKCINVINMNILTHSLVVQCIFLYFPYIKSQFLIRNIIVLIQLFSMSQNICLLLFSDLLPPKLTVNPPVITETDSVTLNCQTPPSVSVSQCYFYTVSGGTVRGFSCLQTLTGTELLKMSHQSSPAEVEVKCYYTVKIGELKSQSPNSNISTVFIHNLLPPKLTVNPPLITETDSVTLNCQTPPSFSVSQCYFYTVSGGTVRSFSCLQTLTGTELLKMSHQSSPAEVEVKCYYIVKVGELNSPYLHSNISTVSIHNIVEGESSMTQTMPTYSVTKDIVEKESSMTQTMPTFTVTKGWTVKMSGASVKLTSGWPVATSSNTGCSTSLTPVKPASAGTWIWKSGVVVTACGVITGTIMLLAICCNKRRADYAIQCQIILLCVSFTLAGPEEVKEQEPQNENGDTYHMYCTISEEPATFALKDMMYSTVQKH
ncbi:uncharacterized protein LOC127372542 isoform X16 [Dicentrarchus labrax]|uniref:uncharacterized protein LOC127372542 isoform X16 n=1 Tax=Dicentrarchus labrax TaxID=13489 RepID=UPI0021F6397C|nr:uncharacterized protein LOC127372542 isoform X16 [Dicentrarchus labrax]